MRPGPPLTLLLALLLVLGACSKERARPAPSPGASARGGTPPEGAKGQAGTEVVDEAETPPRQAHKKPHTPIFVGGCRERCREPISAFRAFLKAAGEDPEGGGVAPFLNTAELVVNGEPLGEAWAALWVQKRWPEREAAVRDFTRSFLAWLRNLPDPPEFDATIRDGVRVLKDESEEALLLWRRPRFADSEPLSAAVWRFVLRPRGLEWLIVEIDQHSGPLKAGASNSRPGATSKEGP